jgi:hypothetical protein
MGRRPTAPGWGHYLGKAFLLKWNLLLFPAAVVAALISGVPDIALPLVLAGEMTYLAGLTAQPKFRKAIDAQKHATKQVPAELAESKNRDRLETVLRSLSRDARERFQGLRDRCVEMQSLAEGVRGHTKSNAMDNHHTDTLNRMLWVFVRLLASQQALTRFLQTTDAVAMQRRVTELNERIDQAKADDNDKILRALIDSVATAQLRVDNLQKAEENAEFVEIELDRIEDKIKALVEMAVSTEDPDYISSQVDSVAASISDTEAAIREMAFLPGVDDGLDDSAPSILSVSA